MEMVCRYCRQKFTPHPLARNQECCGKGDCKRLWKCEWQKQKLARDPDYRENQAYAQKAWRDRNPGYWKEYRKRNPASAERNRLKQRERNRVRRHPSAGSPPPVIAKMDEPDLHPISTSRCDRLIPIIEGLIAKMDLRFSEISSLPRVLLPRTVDGS